MYCSILGFGNRQHLTFLLHTGQEASVMADAGCLCFRSTAPCMTDMIVHWASRMAGILPQHHNGCYWALPAPLFNQLRCW